jgi:hypothetical protein
MSIGLLLERGQDGLIHNSAMKVLAAQVCSEQQILPSKKE